MYVLNLRLPPFSRIFLTFYLGNTNTVDRRVYLDSPLSIQVVTPKQHDYDLFKAMYIIDKAIREQQGTSTKGDSRL